LREPEGFVELALREADRIGEGKYYGARIDNSHRFDDFLVKSALKTCQECQEQIQIRQSGITTFMVERPSNAVGLTYSMMSVKFVKGGPL